MRSAVLFILVFVLIIQSGLAKNLDFNAIQTDALFFTVEVKDKNGPIAGAEVEMLLNNRVMVSGNTGTEGDAILGISNYQKDFVTIRIKAAGYKQYELRNLILEPEGVYEIMLTPGEGSEVRDLKPKEQVVASPAPKNTTSKKDVKRRKKEAAAAQKKENAYRKELAEIRKEESEMESTRGRLVRLQKELDEEKSKGSVSQSDAKKRQNTIDSNMKKVEEQDKKIKEKIQALKLKYGKE